MSNPVENLVHLVHPSSFNFPFKSKKKAGVQVPIQATLSSLGPMSNQIENLVHLVHLSNAIAKDSRVPFNLNWACVKFN